MDKLQSLIKSSWKCSLPTKLRNRDVDWFLQFCPKHLPRSGSGRERGNIAKKKVILSVVKMYCSCIQPDFNQPKSPRVSLHYFRLSMHKSTRNSVYCGCWGNLIWLLLHSFIKSLLPSPQECMYPWSVCTDHLPLTCWVNWTPLNVLFKMYDPNLVKVGSKCHVGLPKRPGTTIACWSWPN